MKFRILNRNPLYDYREACKITQGTLLDETDNEIWEPKNKDITEWWIKQIICNHSTIRSIHFRLVDNRPKSVIMQIIRATKGHPQPYVQSSRPDWNGGKERSSDPYEDRLFMQDHTAESFIDMAKQRLCIRTEARTRKFMMEMVQSLKSSTSPFLKAVGYCCMPQCKWNGNLCPEVISCHVCPSLSEHIIEEYKLDNNIPLMTEEEKIKETYLRG